MKKQLKFFFSVWGGVLVVNQIFIFNGCFTPYCLIAALPHTGIITFFLTWLIIKEGKDTKKACNEGPQTRNEFPAVENVDLLKKKGDQYEKFIGGKIEEKGDIVIYNGLIQGYKDEGVDIIAISPNGKSINYIQCKNWTSKPLELSDIKEIYEKLNKFDFGSCIRKLKESTIYENLQIQGIGKGYLTNKIGKIRKEYSIYTIRKTLYISSEKVVNLEVGRYLRMIKPNIFCYEDMKIVVVEEPPS